MKKTTLFFFLLLTIDGFCQSSCILNDSLAQQSQIFAVLPDHGYRIEQVAGDSTLRFTVDAILQSPGIYWLRINVVNPYPTARSYNIWVTPRVRNTLYYFDNVSGKWLKQVAGFLEPRRQRQVGNFYFDFQGNTRNIIYVKLDLRAPGVVKSELKAKVNFVKSDAAAKQREQNISTAWILSLTVLLLFLLNNLYIYFSFRDKSVGYYLMVQLAGMMYITSYWEFFRVLIPSPIFSFDQRSYHDFYDLTRLLMHASIVFILFSFVQLTRSFLNTKQTLPGADKTLKYGLYTYVAFSLIAAAVNVSGFFIESHTVIFDNVFCLMLLATILYTSTRGYFLKLRAATAFLAANVLPLAFMIGIPLFHVFISHKSIENLWLPAMAIVTQALGFSIAMVDKTKSIQADLKTKEIEHRQMEFDLREAEMKRQLMESQHEKMSASHEYQTARNELLQQRLEANQRELASSTLYMVQKNELLTNLKTEINDLSRRKRSTTPENLKHIKSLLENTLQLDADWNKFKVHFEQVHPDFFKNLSIKHPTLTVKEVRLYAYFHMKLSHKEIAALVNIDPASVRRAKTRLYKKLSIPETEERIES